MEVAQAANQSEQTTAPHQVWQTLTTAQQQTVLRTVVQICQRLSTQSREEETNEPAADKSGRE
jgi:hypothetical protein